AGNEGRLAYEHAFVNSGKTYSFSGAAGEVAMDFGGGNLFQNITIARNTTIDLEFQWASPDYSANPSSGGATTDLDIFLLNSRNRVVAAGGDFNILSENGGTGTGDPSEFLSFTNITSNTSFKIAIGRFDTTSAPDPVDMKYVISSSG